MNLTEARAAVTAHEAAKADLARHEEAVRLHAARKPTSPAGPEPKSPAGERPTPEAVSAAKARIAAAERAKGARGAAERALADAEEGLTTAEAAHTAAAERARVAGRLPAIVRAAPGVLLGRQLAALPEMPHVRVSVDGEAIKVEGWSERGLWLDIASLSTGEQIRSWAELRAAIRHSAATKWPIWAQVPIPVDERGSWSGDLDAVGLRIEMVTGGAS